MSTHLLIIDPQNDFCDSDRGALYVKGAENDMRALAGFVSRHSNRIDQIHVTLDTHQTVHVAHPVFWKDREGQHPAPFTTITRAEVEAGRWTTADPGWQVRGLGYVQALERNQRYQLMIWPPHCRLGTWGHGVFPELAAALLAWEERRLGRVNFILKGSNPFTEHYSAVVADVPDEGDVATQLNTALIERLKAADEILVAGEALSHCVAHTVVDIAAHLGEDQLQKLNLLRNTVSNVTGCESLGDRFLETMARRGMRVSTAQDFPG
jgi:nicotinamidase-related amidase